MKLKPYRGNFIGHKDQIMDMFVAHEVQDVVPQAATGKKDETRTAYDVIVDEKGNYITEGISIDRFEELLSNKDERFSDSCEWKESMEVEVYQGVDTSMLVPLLTAALQEAIREIKTLKEKR